MSSYYNKQYALDNKIKLNNKKELDKLFDINNIFNIKRNINKYTHKNKSCSVISEYITPKSEDKSKQKNEKNEDKLIIKTSLIKSKKDNIGEKGINEQDKYHINFELLSNAGINKDININMTFV